MIQTILLLWATLLLIFALGLMRGNAHWNEPKPEPHPTPEQVNDVLDIYEILG